MNEDYLIDIIQSRSYAVGYAEVTSQETLPSLATDAVLSALAPFGCLILCAWKSTLRQGTTKILEVYGVVVTEEMLRQPLDEYILHIFDQIFDLLRVFAQSRLPLGNCYIPYNFTYKKLSVRTNDSYSF